MPKTIFEKIIDGEIASEKVFESENIVAIKDLHPVAPVHFLIITRKVIPDLQSLQQDDLPLIGEVVQVAQKLAKEFDIEKGYRLLTNVGPSAGQSIYHLHFHLIGGRGLGRLG